MSIQTPIAAGIPAGFGDRLKQERKRLNLSQAQMAEAGGVQRLAQIQYENERTAPTTRYLSDIAKSGVDLSYLVLGLKFGGGALTPEQERRVEEKVFEWIRLCAQQQPDQRFTVETFQVLYRLFKGVQTQIELGVLPADSDPTSLLAGAVARLHG